MLKKIQGLFAFAVVALSSQAALAADMASSGDDKGMMYFAIAFGIGLAAFGGAFGQSRAAAAALEGICRNPNAADKVQTPMLLGLAFIESLVLFAWVLMFLLFGKL